MYFGCCLRWWRDEDEVEKKGFPIFVCVQSYKAWIWCTYMSKSDSVQFQPLRVASLLVCTCTSVMGCQRGSSSNNLVEQQT